MLSDGSSISQSKISIRGKHVQATTDLCHLCHGNDEQKIRNDRQANDQWINGKLILCVYMWLRYSVDRWTPIGGPKTTFVTAILKH